MTSSNMMTMITDDDQIEFDEMILISHLCPPAIHHLAPHDHHQGHEEKTQSRRRTKKMKEGGENMSSGIRIKRKLNEEQVKCLEESFENEHKLESEKKDRLASELGLDPRQVAIWFQNRRVRWKCKNVEDEYFKLKSQHDSNLIHNSQLQTQVLQLKEQLSQAQKEIQRLLERQLDGNNPAASTISSIEMQPPFLGDLDNASAISMSQPLFSEDFPMDNGSAILSRQPPFFGEFTMDGLENLFNYLPQNNYVEGGFEWVNTMM